MATLLKLDGTIETVTPKNGKNFSLEEMQEFVGGFIEAVYLPNKMVMFINEEGKLYNLPVNLQATTMVEGIIRDSDYIVGNALICNLVETGDKENETA